jgi:hypothetical protein
MFPIRLAFLSACGACLAAAEAPRGYNIPMLELAREDVLFSTVERRAGYLGHPSTVLFRDGRTLLVSSETRSPPDRPLGRRSGAAGRTKLSFPRVYPPP